MGGSGSFIEVEHSNSELCYDLNVKLLKVIMILEPSLHQPVHWILEAASKFVVLLDGWRNRLHPILALLQNQTNIFKIFSIFQYFENIGNYLIFRAGVTFKGVLLNSTSALGFVTSCLRTSRSSSSLKNVLQQVVWRLSVPQLWTLYSRIPMYPKMPCIRYGGIRGAPIHQIRSFFEHCSKSLWPPPPPSFWTSCCKFFWWIS